MRRPLLPLLLLLVAIVLCWPLLKPVPNSPLALPTVSASSSVQPAETPVAELLPQAGEAAHAVTLASLGKGKVMAAWFSGSREGANDVAIYSAIYEQNRWSTPHRIVDRRSVQRDTQRLIRKVGNPLLWRDAENVLHLWFVSVSYGGWAGSAVNHLQSNDDGEHWSSATRVVASPFWNLSTLVRNPPTALADGGFALPVYHEFLNKRPEWLRFDKRGQLIDKARIPNSAGTLQPAVAALDQHRLLALMRSSNASHRIHVARSEDAGQHWQPAAPTDIANPDSALALIRLADGSLLLACNPLDANRTHLALLRSRDDGKHWSPPYIVELGSGNDEFSYPALLQDDAGIVHLAYTWKRQAIKHIAVSATIISGLR